MREYHFCGWRRKFKIQQLRDRPGKSHHVHINQFHTPMRTETTTSTQPYHPTLLTFLFSHRLPGMGKVLAATCSSQGNSPLISQKDALLSTTTMALWNLRSSAGRRRWMLFCINGQKPQYLCPMMGRGSWMCWWQWGTRRAGKVMIWG